MRKVFISFSSLPAIEKNANEYSVFPKTNTFGAKFDDKEISAAFTSGKGKSAIPNYYLYFRDEKNAIYYFRSNPEEIEAAKKGFAVYSVEPKAAEPEPLGTYAEEEAKREAETPSEAPEAPKRRRSRSTV